MPTHIDKLKALGVKATSIEPHIHIIQGMMRGRSPFCNCILVLDKTTTLIDTGCGLELTEKILQTFTIDLIINSHSHPDHTAGNWRIIEKNHPSVMVPHGSQDSIGDESRLARRLVGQDLAEYWIKNNLCAIDYKNFAYTDVFAEGHIFDLGEIQLQAMHTPGHAQDHFCFYEPQRNIVFGSDIDLSPFGPWYGNQESELDALKSSIERVLALKSDIYVSSHAKVVQNRYIAKRLHAYASVLAERSALIYELIDAYGPISLKNLVLSYPIYGHNEGQVDKIIHYNETRMVEKHVEELIQDGKVARLQDGQLKAT